MGPRSGGGAQGGASPGGAPRSNRGGLGPRRRAAQQLRWSWSPGIAPHSIATLLGVNLGLFSPCLCWAAQIQGASHPVVTGRHGFGADAPSPRSSCDRPWSAFNAGRCAGIRCAPRLPSIFVEDLCAVAPSSPRLKPQVLELNRCRCRWVRACELRVVYSRSEKCRQTVGNPSATGLHSVGDE